MAKMIAVGRWWEANTLPLSVSRFRAIHLSRKRARKGTVHSSLACGRGGIRAADDGEGPCAR